MSDNLNLNLILKQKTQSLYKELFRKTIHICSAFVPSLLKVAYYHTIGLLFFALIAFCICEILRLKGFHIPLVSNITETAARRRDSNKFVLGPVTLVFGILLAAIFLPNEAARIGIYALAFGDGTASLVGKLIGRVIIPWSGGKTAAGSLACFVGVYISCFFVCKNAFGSLLIALFGMIIELLPLKDFDNLLIPIAIGSLFLII